MSTVKLADLSADARRLFEAMRRAQAAAELARRSPTQSKAAA